MRQFLGLIGILGLMAGCAGFTSPEFEGEEPQAMRDYNVVRLDVVVPGALSVAEENALYPGADIVWRGDPPGDRYAQVAAIVEDGMGRGLTGLEGTQDVIVQIQMERFHSLTERARYSVGGVHSIRFLATVFDAETREIIEGPRRVQADLDAFRGQQALDADAAGQTPKVRITDHLEGVASDLYPDGPI